MTTKRVKNAVCIAVMLVLAFVYVSSAQNANKGSVLAAEEERQEESAAVPVAVPAPKLAEQPAVSDNFRAVWVSTVLNLDYPSKAGLSADAQKQEIDDIVYKSSELGLNALVFQVRPSGDALYKSDIFPWSRYLTGEQGAPPSGGFDPLAYMIQQAHSRGIEVHAWVNPYRVSHTADKITDVNGLSADNPARQNPDIVKLYNGALYYDPGEPKSKQLVIDGVTEILKNYDVDGIHLDDYFYPAPDFADAATYDKYGRATGLSLEDWRRENVNDVIKGVQKAVRETKPSARFGVAPVAIWQNAGSDPLGSDTKGYESYKSIYADTRRWVKEGWLDYICPQIYWQIGYNIADYQKVLAWWDNVCKDTNVDLYVGHAAYKQADDSGWSGEMLRQLKLNENYNVKGDIFFRAKHLDGSVGTEIRDYYLSRPLVSSMSPTAPPEPTPEPVPEPVPTAPIVSNLKMTDLFVGIPSGNVTVTGGKGYMIVGTANPDLPLYINGNEVTNRTPEGFFSAFAGISAGTNTFKVTQGAQTVTRTITSKPATGGGGGGSSSAPKITVYDNAPNYAIIKADNAWAYPSYTTNGGSNWELSKGQIDIIDASTENWVKLRSGLWVEKKNIDWVTQKSLTYAEVGTGTYTVGETNDILSFASDENAATNIKYDGKSLTISIGMLEKQPTSDIDLEHSIFKGYSGGVYTLKDGVILDGFYTEYSGGKINVILKKHRHISGGDAPLKSFSFVVDPGHGDDDTGALGPMGTKLAEKDFNLTNGIKLAEKLRSLGASVTLTRETDVFHSLQARTDMSLAAKPDMFISIHANSMEPTVDTTNTHGLTIWYMNSLSQPLANRFMRDLARVNPLSSREAKPSQANLFVVRPVWTPSVLVETSFMCNINDFSWLASEEEQNKLADAITNAILEYYKD